MGDKPTLFIVDDCAAYKVLISIMLKKAGYEVRSFESAELVLSALETDIPDMIISDLEMPYMDGLDFFRVLKRQGYTYRAIPFVIISSIENESRIEEVQRVSKRPLIKKSIPMSAIIEKIREILENPSVSIMNDSLKKTTHKY
ncbi:MAG: response regulator [Balneolaceae bacterium]